MNHQDLLNVATAAADIAAEITIAGHRKILDGGDIGIDTKSSPRDMVTEVDGNAQEAIVATIRETYPDHRFFCEEEMDDKGPLDAPYEWIIDPLDGTLPFIHGKDSFGTIITCASVDDLVIGVIDQPLLKRRFTAIRGEGTYCNGEKCTLRNTRDLNDAILTGNLRHRAVEGEHGRYATEIPNCASIENYGSAVEEFSQLLLGHNDGLFLTAPGPGLWDVAAGLLMVEEAGGRTRWEFADPNDPRAGVNCIASTGAIFEELEKFVFGEST